MPVRGTEPFQRWSIADSLSRRGSTGPWLRSYLLTEPHQVIQSAMLQSLENENFRCFKRHQIPFRDNTVIVGQNNAGKSTLIEALRLVGLAQSRYKTLRYEGPPDWLDKIGVRGPGFSPSIERFDLSTEGLFHQYSHPPARLSARFWFGTQLVVYIGPAPHLFVTAQRSKVRPEYS